MSLIACDRLTLSYDGRPVLSELSFAVEPGEYLIIVGENGSGKSTLIKALLGLKAPSAGQIVYGDGLKSREIGYLPQRIELQKDFPASVREVILSGCLNRHGLFSRYSEADRRDAAFQAERLGIAGLKNRSFSELSGGQQQRVLLARALCAAKKMILLDEPAAGLDPEATAEFYEILKKLHREGVTVVMVSHDLLAAVRYASRILRIGNGGCASFSPEEFRKTLSGSEGRACP